MRRLVGLAEAAKSTKSLEFKSDGRLFTIHWSVKRNRFVVSVTDENWGYDDESHADDMSDDIRDAPTLDAAAEILGVGEEE